MLDGLINWIFHFACLKIVQEELKRKIHYYEEIVKVSYLLLKAFTPLVWCNWCWGLFDICVVCVGLFCSEESVLPGFCWFDIWTPFSITFWGVTKLLPCIAPTKPVRFTVCINRTDCCWPTTNNYEKNTFHITIYLSKQKLRLVLEELN